MTSIPHLPIHPITARAQDHQGPRRHVLAQVPPRQAGVPRSVEIRPSRRVQAPGEHANAMGAGSALQGDLPRHRRHHLRQRDPEGDRARVRGAVGDDVDHDAKGEARSPALQAHAVPPV